MRLEIIAPLLGVVGDREVWMELAVRPPIIRDDNGVPYIAGTTCKVIEVVRLQAAFGYSAEDLHRELPHLGVAQIRFALDHYQAHREELDADIERRDEMVERLREEAGPSPVAARLRAAGKLR